MRRTATLLLGSFWLSLVASAACSSDEGDPRAASSASSSSGDPGDATVSSSSSSSSGDSGPVVLAEAGGDASDSGIDAGPYPGIHFTGRFDFRDAAGPKFEWSGTAIQAKFRGTGIAVRLAETLSDQNEHQQFRITIDGQTTSLLVLNGSPAYTLASGLPDGEHTVEVFKRTEALFGTVQFLGFDVEAGAIVPSEFPYTRRLEFLGDSITAGYGNEGVGPSCTFSADTEDGSRAYGAIAAKALGAAYSAIAWSGRGLRVNYGDAALPTMPELYGLTRPWDETSAWDFGSYVPDAVVIHLGTNDTWHTADPGAEFTTEYVALLTRIRGLYPQAHVFVIAAPERAGVVTRASAAVDQRNQAGDAAVHFLQLDNYDLMRDGVGCDSHPSVAAHAVVAAKLEAAIRAALGW